jgi:ABC-2 type transport system ATP-binding protein
MTAATIETAPVAAAPARHVAVRTRGLVKRYGSFTAVAGVDLDIGAQEIFGLVGPNGAGKTTTLRMLATSIVPTAGEASVAGIDVVGRPGAVRRVTGYMPDTFGVYDDLRAWEYLDFYAHLHGVSASRRRTLVGDLLELVDLAAKRDAYVQTLSRGMQQRLCLAHALVHDPQVLLLDEPASGLDPRARAELRELLRELRSMGKTIVISSHILPELEELCTGVAIIDHGRVLAAGPIAAIQARFRQGSVVRVRVLGEDAAALEAATWLGVQPEVAVAETLEDGRIELALRGDEEAAPVLLLRMLNAGHRVTAFVPVASDLEELFLEITGQEPPNE